MKIIAFITTRLVIGKMGNKYYYLNIDLHRRLEIKHPMIISLIESNIEIDIDKIIGQLINISEGL